MDGCGCDLFASGLLTLEAEAKPLLLAELEVVFATEGLLTVREGHYHQARRVFASTGNYAEKLHCERLDGL
ncbi:MAG: hypothetical protein Q7J44_10040 [Pseudotabrizicola sp.]|uniref:hypothetical protein n=1 Tax=Pseudotabrizicola sp. TaxID=2939647 RepID=UPI002716A737|nr:hypothetical protein [Pseudotabrizicola sp.]MDO9638871.1 hypothetical protein [Pseudotabrizicola sp.]